MADYEASTYGEHIAEVYDTLYRPPAAAVIDLLAELAGGGPVLELGIGTGRIALPLLERGIAVHGVDASAAMVERLRRKPGGAGIPVTVADFGSVQLAGRYSLIFVAFNTIFALPSQAEQVDCFRTVAAHLRPGGAFLVEAFVPDPARFDRGQRLATSHVADSGVWLEAASHDPVQQRVESRLVRIAEDGVRLFPVRVRYAWPAELDLMARLAGLALRSRWGGWSRQPFTAESGSHVSVYAAPAPRAAES